MTRKFYLAYAFMDATGAGYGNVFAFSRPDAGLTEALIVEWQEMIRDSRQCESVTILYVTELEG